MDTRDTPEYDNDTVERSVRPDNLDPRVEPEDDKGLMVDTQVKPEYDNRIRMCFKPEYDGERCLIKGLECIENAESGVAIPYAENQLLFSIKKI